MRGLKNALAVCSLIDIGFFDPPFTWTNMRRGLANIREMLDRSLCNCILLLKFLESIVIHLPCTRSDHHPLVVREHVGTYWTTTKRPFRMLDAWFARLDFKNLVRIKWEQDQPLLKIMKQFKSTISHWNKFKFGNIFERKQRCRA